MIFWELLPVMCQYSVCQYSVSLGLSPGSLSVMIHCSIFTPHTLQGGCLAWHSAVSECAACVVSTEPSPNVFRDVTV